MLAARNGHAEVVKLLLAKGAHVNARRSWGLTALMLAADNGNAEVVRLLLDNGADLTATWFHGDAAIGFAAKKRHSEVIRLLDGYQSSYVPPKKPSEKEISVEAETLEEARNIIATQIPSGLSLLEERIVSDGTVRAVKASAATIEEAFLNAKSKLPAAAKIVKESEIVIPSKRSIVVEAFDEATAKSHAKNRINKDETIRSTELSFKGRKGFLGMGKSPNHYEITVTKEAVVEVSYKTAAKITATIGKRSREIREYFFCGEVRLRHRE